MPIYELGTFADRRPFFTMKLVKGDTLAELLDGPHGPGRRPAPVPVDLRADRARRWPTPTPAGVIHRDLKPSNVMVGSFGEVQVMDWGLAKVLPRGGVADDATAGKEPPQETVIATARSGSDDRTCRTPARSWARRRYMAPEQARGEIDRVDERADVFALGSILCEILTGQPAFTGRDVGRDPAQGGAWATWPTRSPGSTPAGPTPS